MTWIREVRLGVPALLLALLLLVTVAGAATAQDGEAEPSARLTLSAITGVLGPGSLPPAPDTPTEGAPPPPEPPEDLELRLLVSNDGETPLENLRVVTEVFSSVDSRSLLRQTLDAGEIDRRLREVIEVDVRDGAELVRGDVAGVRVTVPGDAIGWADESGVFPVQVSVFRGSEQLDGVVTAAVHLATAPDGVLRTVVVWPLDAMPWRGAAGVYPAGVDSDIQPGGRLDRILDAAERVAGSGLVLAPSPHLLEDLADRADGFRASVRTDEGIEIRTFDADQPEARLAAAFLARVRELTAALRHAPVAGPYADADVATLTGAPEPLPGVAGTLVSQGRRRLQVMAERSPDRSTYLATTPLDTASLGLLPAEHLLLAWDHVEGPDLESNPDLPLALRSITTGTRRFTAAVADPRLTTLLTLPDVAHGPAVAVQRVLAETAMLYLVAPARSGRPLLVMPPPGWDPQPRLPAPILASLSTAPWLDLVAPSEQVDAAAGTVFPTARLRAVEPGLPGGVLDELVRATRDLEALRAATLPDVEDLAGRAPDQLADQLLRASSSWFTGGEVGGAATLVRDVQAVVDESFGTVEVPSSVGITLTSDSGNIPVTLQRARGVPLRVQVEVESQGRLTWPGEGRIREVTLDEGSKTVSFSTRALSRGRFPVTVTVSDPSGTRVLERVTLSVSATAISRPALFITGGVVVALLLWGAFRRRRPRRPRLEVVG